MVEILLLVLVVVLCVMFIYQRKKYLDECAVTEVLDGACTELEKKLAESEKLSECRMKTSQSFNSQLNDAQSELTKTQEDLVKAQAEIALLKSKLTRKPKNKVAKTTKTEKK